MAPPPDAPLPEGNRSYRSHGSTEANTAPSPMNSACMAYPCVRCSGRSRSATNARKGSMLMLIDASSTHRSPAAIQSVPELGMAISAAEASSAPVRK